jgi:hypothetical protein
MLRADNAATVQTRKLSRLRSRIPKRAETAIVVSPSALAVKPEPS